MEYETEVLNRVVKKTLEKFKTKVALYQLNKSKEYNSLISPIEWMPSPFSNKMLLKHSTPPVEKHEGVSCLEICLYTGVIEDVIYSYNIELTVIYGKGYIVTNNERKEITKGSCINLSPDEPHDFYIEKETLIYAIFKPKLKEIK